MCDPQKVREKVNEIIDNTILGKANSISKIADRFVITYSKQFQVKTREQAYNMAVSKVDTLNKRLSELGYSQKFGPYVEIDQSLDNRIVIHKLSLDKLMRAYELRNKAEEEDRTIKDLLDEIDNKYAQDRVNNEVTNNLQEVVYDIDVDSNKVPKDQYTSFINSRNNLIDSLRIQRKGESDLVKKSIISERIKRLQEQVKNIENKDTRSFDLVLKFAKSDIEVVKKILDNNPAKSSIDYSYPLISNYSAYLGNTFSNVISELDDSEKKDYYSIIGELEDLSTKVKNAALIEANKLTNRLVGGNIVDINGVLIDVADIPNISAFRASRQLTDITRVNNPIVQSISKLIKKSKHTIDLLSNRFTTLNNELVSNLVKFQKNSGLTKDNYYEYMIQIDFRGNRTGRYVSKYSDEYYKTRRDESIDNDTKFKFWVDNHKFKFNKEAWEVRRKNLEDEFEVTYVDKIVLTDLDIKRGISIEDKINSERAKYISRNSAEEMLNIFSSAQKGTITKSQVKFFTDYLSKGRLNRVKVGEELMFPIEFEAIDKWIDPKYNIIQSYSNIDPRKLFYNHFIKNTEESYSRIQSEDDWLDWSYIPEKSKKGSIVNQLKDSVINSISQNISQKVQIKDPVTGEFTKSIPKYMTGKNLDIIDKSFDLGDIMNDFYRESVRFNNMYTIEDDVQYLLAALRSTRTFDTNRQGEAATDNNGDRIFKKGDSDLYKMTLYTVNSLLYNESQDIEGITNSKLMSAKTKDKVNELTKQLKSINLSEDELAEAQKYVSQDEPYLGSNQNIGRFVEIGRQIEAFKPLMKTITGTKIGNTLISFTGFKLIAFSLFGGIGETLQGLYALNIAAAGGKWFNGSQATKAIGEVTKSLNPGYIGKVRNISKYFNVVNEKIEGTEMQKNKLTDAGYFLYKSANYLANNSFLIAMLMNKKIKDLLGNEHSLYSVLNVTKDGKFELPDNFEKNYFQNNDGTPTDNLTHLMTEFEDMLKSNRERRNSNDPIQLNQKFLGRALGQFKSNWMIEGFLFRFQDYVNYGDGREMKGFYRSIGEIFKVPTTTDLATGEVIKDYSVKGVSKAAITGFSELLKFSFFGKLAGFKPNEQLSDLDIANLKMFIREASWGLTMFTTIAICSSMIGGNDDDKNLPFYKYVINQSTRLLRDITTYSSPSSFMSLTKNPMPFMSSVKDIFDLGTKVMQSPLLLSPNYDDSQLHLLKAIENNTPAVRQVRQTLNKINKTINYTE